MLRAVHMLEIHQDAARAELNSFSYIKSNSCVIYCTGTNGFFSFSFFKKIKQFSFTQYFS